ncbi:hypothetical protein GA0116948_11037 [Chitinophaga costaii]|uniref:Methylamine utilisation protein MauE domain-containing protein n=1 Tax=Chitinophaga costaii TaxID=1335309 RepID=A0A1C4EVX1_9BACT|nr:MauE/DoxX family redox-associated membrane protein [Chitinophaga costaii]PUZ21622.1 hypothetical protein DCM91_16445 [Chitinophaga costaii]SCC47626.1 hypothetical protein GA0116948_11037 [Chitinophaga costaii]
MLNKVFKASSSVSDNISSTSRKYVIEICAALLTLLFLYTSLSKLLTFDDYVGQINNQPFDNYYTPYFVYGLPATEFIAVILLFINRTRLLGFVLSLFMMTMFTGYIVLVLANFYGRIPCSCGGVINHITWKQHLWFNFFFIIVALTGLIFQYKENRIHGL